jgi:hypothetical protein
MPFLTLFSLPPPSEIRAMAETRFHRAVGFMLGNLAAVRDYRPAAKDRIDLKGSALKTAA